MTQKAKFVLRRVENFVRKVENAACYQHAFSSFPTIVSTAFCSDLDLLYSVKG